MSLHLNHLLENKEEKIDCKSSLVKYLKLLRSIAALPVTISLIYIDKYSP